MTVWGVGPKIALVTVPYAAIMIFLHFWFYPQFLISVIPVNVFIISGIFFIVFGFPVWLSSAMKIDRMFARKVLATKGIYGIMRNPVYAGSYYMHLGIILFFRSWALLTVPLVFYAVFRILIKNEEVYLGDNYGEEFTSYKKSINAFLPTPGKIYNAFFYPPQTCKISENLFAVKSGDVNLFILREGESIICIDSGYRRGRVKDELNKIGIKPENISCLFLTHGDADHAGGLHNFPDARVFLSRDEEEMINGSRARFAGLYRSPRLNREYSLLDDGDIIKAGPVTVKAIAAPGHTPGHMAYLVNDELLFTGDAVLLQNGGASPFYRVFNMDHGKAIESVKKLAGIKGITMICTSHTGYTRMCDQYFEYWRQL